MWPHCIHLIMSCAIFNCWHFSSQQALKHQTIQPDLLKAVWQNTLSHIHGDKSQRYESATTILFEWKNSHLHNCYHSFVRCTLLSRRNYFFRRRLSSFHAIFVQLVFRFFVLPTVESDFINEFFFLARPFFRHVILKWVWDSNTLWVCRSFPWPFLENKMKK